MRNFKNLIVWQESIDLVKKIYNLSSNLPIEERYGLISQMNRASVSIASNIAEGSSRSSEKEFKRFLEIALGSAFELETQLIVVKDLEIGNQKLIWETHEMIIQIQKKIYNLKLRLK